jgi:diaminopimelate decarboxylase
MSNVKANHPLRYRQGQLFLEKMNVASLASAIGTPCYLYSAGDMEDRYRQFDHAFRKIPHHICYAVKANSNVEILRLFRRLGSGFDIVSGGELFRVLKAGARPSGIVFSGVGKTVEEIDYALTRRIGQFNAESVEELSLLEARAGALKRAARVSLRVNPDVDPKTHPYIATGLREHKFGIDMRRVPEIFQASRRFKRIQLVGIGCHIGSQILDVRPFVDAARILARAIRQLRQSGFMLSVVDLGGGLGIPYQDESAPTPEGLAREILPVLEPLGCNLLFEPGRWLVARAGVLVTRVLFTKRNGRKKFMVVDAGMNDLIRPSLYQSYHQILPARARRGSPLEAADVVGPICETGDFFARDRQMPSVEPGDVLVIRDAGAYGFTLASNYNSHPRCAEVLIRGQEAYRIRRRETFEDLVKGEKVEQIPKSNPPRRTKIQTNDQSPH